MKTKAFLIIVMCLTLSSNVYSQAKDYEDTANSASALIQQRLGGNETTSAAAYKLNNDWIVTTENPPQKESEYLLGIRLLEPKRVLFYKEQRFEVWTCSAFGEVCVDLIKKIIYAPEYSDESDNWLKQSFERTELIKFFEKEREIEVEKIKQNNRTQYLDAAKKATTIPLIDKFEAQYKDNDPDLFIPKLQEIKENLQYKEYRENYDSAKTSQDLKKFIARYTDNDKDNLVPIAASKLPELEKRELAIQKEKDAKAELDKKNLAIKNLENSIGYCNRMIDNANQQIARERKISLYSGYENKLLLHDAARTIVDCQEQNEKKYTEYKKLGGKKSLYDIN